MSPVDQVDEVLDHPQGRLLHLCQQEPVDHPVSVPVGGDTVPPSLSALGLVLARGHLIIHSPVVELPEAAPGYDDRMGGVYLRVELWPVLHVAADLGGWGRGGGEVYEP